MSKPDVNQTNVPQVLHYLCGERVIKRKKAKIVDVQPYEDIGYDILTENDTSFVIQKKLTDVVPCVGDDIVFYTIWFSKVVGVELNGKLLYFLTEENIW